jgi:arylsulfatase A-like enzyme
MKRTLPLFSLCGLIFIFSCAAKESGSDQAQSKDSSQESDSEQPNIVLIIADDMGYSDLGCYGGEIETPQLDKLADKGLRFTNFYVHNMCWPTRASLLTSLYPKSALKDGSASKGFRDNIIMLPQALKEVGYKSYMSGKWHLSDPKEPHGPSAPHKRGFDRTYATYHGTTDFFAPADLNENG